MWGGSRWRRFATRLKISCRPGSNLSEDPNTTSTYAMPAIDEPRTAVEPGIDLNDSVSTWVTRVETSVAECPIQSTRSPTCGSERSGTASRDSGPRARPRVLWAARGAGLGRTWTRLASNGLITPFEAKQSRWHEGGRR